MDDLKHYTCNVLCGYDLFLKENMHILNFFCVPKDSSLNLSNIRDTVFR